MSGHDERRPLGSGLASPAVDVVVPTVGRISLATLLRSIDAAATPSITGVVVVDDRPRPAAPLRLPSLQRLQPTIVAGPARGPAAARNAGWRVGRAPWVVFLDDDVEVGPGWARRLEHDLAAATPDVVAVQGRIEVPLDDEADPTEAELATAQLAHARWITADMAVRRAALVRIGGFDERFPRAYREDTDLALRLMDAGGVLRQGDRSTVHPVRPSGWSDCLARQRGNMDDELMRRLHGAEWRERGAAPAGLRRSHVLTTTCAAVALGAAAMGRRRVAEAALAVWVLRWWRLLARRRTPGRDSLGATVGLAVTSALIPPLATWWSAVGRWRARRLAPGGWDDRWGGPRPALVLFDRDGTLVHDVPYNGDPGRVRPVEGARTALDRLRDSGVKVGLVTNQSGVARGLLEMAQVDAVNARLEQLLGTFDTVQVCPHGDDDACECRKPSPGMVLAAAEHLGVPPWQCAVVGDIGSDVQAGLAAGARAVLVPTSATLPDEVATSPETASDLLHAVDLLLVRAAEGSR